MKGFQNPYRTANLPQREMRMILLRYLGFFGASLALPVFVLVPWHSGMDGAGLIRLLVIAVIYACGVVFILIGFKPSDMRRAIVQSPTGWDDLYLWLAPILVLMGWLWAGFHIVGLLALSGFGETQPVLFLVACGAILALAVWVSVRVRKAFWRRDRDGRRR